MVSAKTKTKKRQYLRYVKLISGLIIILAIMITFFFSKKITNHPEESNHELNQLLVGSSQSSQKKAEITKNRVVEQQSDKLWMVDIKGAVKKAGVYQVSDTMRVHDVIQLAGGETDDADMNQINNAEKVSDQMVIYVPKKGETISEITQRVPSKITNNAGSQEMGKVNLNTASLQDLMTLKGVGQKKAEAIIEYRETNNGFQTIEDLKKVKGIGEKTFESLAESVTI
ncbi:helix-hairpin-helix domain-containing protein [Vagococcus penaei]|uniref:helix-hairpin-helix domain-containing protein n=1 Tax=Vagococcus penaei TaxID=633807 RepID=UPI0009844062|nr:helix-hairpin-helix domain-containing protein [Vagococcus penaei]